jgi:hypothetical protein
MFLRNFGFSQLHGATAQKAALFIVSAVIISNPI